MTAAGTAEIVAAAQAEEAGVGAFNLIGMEHAEGIVAGAEQARQPVVLQISENCVKYHGALEPIALAALAIARAAAVPVAVHLDHATSPGLVEQAAGLGVSSVMFDASALDYKENVDATARLVGWCHDRGIWVEAELGERRRREQCQQRLRGRVDPAGRNPAVREARGTSACQAAGARQLRVADEKLSP